MHRTDLYHVIVDLDVHDTSFEYVPNLAKINVAIRQINFDVTL